MTRLTLLGAALLALGDSVVNALNSCGQSQYDPAQVCPDVEICSLLDQAVGLTRLQ